MSSTVVGWEIPRRWVHRRDLLRELLARDMKLRYKRSSLGIVGRIGGYGVKAKVANGQWQALRVEFSGDLFTVFLDAKQLFQVKDKTFTGAGKVGLWTKADSVTLFDDFSYRAKK